MTIIRNGPGFTLTTNLLYEIKDISMEARGLFATLVFFSEHGPSEIDIDCSAMEELTQEREILGGKSFVTLIDNTYTINDLQCEYFEKYRERT